MKKHNIIKNLLVLCRYKKYKYSKSRQKNKAQDCKYNKHSQWIQYMGQLEKIWTLEDVLAKFINWFEHDFQTQLVQKNRKVPMKKNKNHQICNNVMRFKDTKKGFIGISGDDCGPTLSIQKEQHKSTYSLKNKQYWAERKANIIMLDIQKHVPKRSIGMNNKNININISTLSLYDSVKVPICTPKNTIALLYSITFMSSPF